MPALKVRPLSAILLDSAPQQGDGLHHWLIKGARECAKWRKTPEQAYDLIAATVRAKGGEERPRDIWQAINKAYSTSLSAPSGGSYKPTPKWPEAKLELIEEVTLSRITKEGETPLEELWRRSPERPDDSPETTGTIIRRLFPADALICAGMYEWSTTTYELAKLKNLHRFPLVVPNPMSAFTGKTQAGHESGRTLDNTGPRRFPVTEFDFKKHDDQGRPTKWAPLIHKWERHGATVQDACAAIILQMMQAGPLTMVVYSGKKSLHAWWWCAGEPEHEGSRLHSFMADAALLGADTATYGRCQFVRMPGAVRDNGNRQSVHYLNFQHIESSN